MNKEITIVTAFFSINRENWKGFSRSDEKYFEYFKGWAKLKNKLIVYVETEELCDKITEFRRRIGLDNQTIVNVIPNVFDMDRELFDAMDVATSNPIQQLYRMRPNNPDSCNANYNFVQLAKALCVKDAIEKGQADGMVAWLDFGYNHGGTAFTSDSDFNYSWEYDFPEKINITAIQKPDNRPIFDIIYSMDTYIMGGCIIATIQLWVGFWCLMRDSMLSLTECGLCDDDQNIMLMAYRKKPELFKVWYMGWSMQLYEFGGRDHLKLNCNKESHVKSLCKRFWHSFQHRKECAKYALRIYKHIVRYAPK